MRNFKLFLIFLVSLIFSFGCSTIEQEKPNIIIMLVDDAGYADFGFMGCKDLATPNIDGLAKSGVIFTDAHVSATVCGPSRAGLLTGRYQQRFGFECNPSADDVLDKSEETIADVMKKAGYKTAAFGKWHLGHHDGYKPNQRGFDYFWGFLSGSRSYFPYKNLETTGYTKRIMENDSQVEFTGYLTDQLGNKTAEFIEQNNPGETGKPFFIYWAPNAVHTPMEATRESLAKFEGYPRQKLAAMTWSLDQAVGTIINKLKEQGIYDNTLIFFLSDNGGASNNQSSNLPLKGFKGNKFEGGHRVAFVASWPALIGEGFTFSGLTSSLDIFATAADVGKAQQNPEKPLDGVSLVPFLTKEKQGNPHEKLFWRKDEMAAAREGHMKMIRVERLGYRMYDLKNDLGELKDLSTEREEELNNLKLQMKNWESGLMYPLFTEGHMWDTITWMIHEDYYLNRDVRVKSPRGLAQFLSKR